MEENKFTETFELSRFIQEEDFNDLLHRFENDRKPEQIKQKSVMSVEEFLSKTKPEKISTEVKQSNDRGGDKLLRDK
jgi:hypothetical protein